MYYGGPTVITQYSWCTVIVGFLGEENLQNESVLWEVDAYKLAIKVHMRMFMPINQFSLSVYWWYSKE